MSERHWTADRPSLCFARDGSGSRTLIAIHELGGSLTSYDDLVPRLAKDACVIRYDQRGSGLSEKPHRPYPLDAHVDDLERIVVQSGAAPPFDLIALAAGSAIAVMYAHRHPDAVASLALCCAALGVGPDQHTYLASRSALAAREGMHAIEAASLARSYPDYYRAQDPQRFAAYRGTFLANDPVAYGHANMAFADCDLGDAIAALRAPCLLLAGEDDALRPPDQVRLLTAQIPHARFETIKSGHIMPVQAPEPMAERLRAFLQLR
jgi:3-oxoadipate enol-lactonase